MLTKKEVDQVFDRRNKAKWQKVIDAYVFLRAHIDHGDAPEILADYQRTFNYFYQVRRNATWRVDFYALFYEHAKAGKTDFGIVLTALHTKTKKIEASFASKFVATIDPSLPLIDRHVLTYIGTKLPGAHKSKEQRLAAIIALHADMHKEFTAFLKNDPVGHYLVERFRKEYPGVDISQMKMLDFVLWQSGGKNGKKKKTARKK